MPFPHPQPSAIWLAHRARIRKLEQQELVMAESLRIARDLHDTLSHSFTGVIMQVEATRRMLQKGQRDPETHLAWAGRMAREGLNEARRAVYALMPEALEMKPLPEAVGKLVEEIRSEAGEEIELSVNGEFKPLPSVVSLNLFRIVQEALTNARHHAAAAHIHVELDYRDPGLALRVSDDGKGFDPHNTASSGYGLISMRERAERIGGELTIESQPGQGTRVLLAVAL